MCNSSVVPKTTCWYHFEQNTVGSDELSSGYVRVEPTRCSQSNLLEKIWKEKSSFMICWGGFEGGFLKYKSKPPVEVIAIFNLRVFHVKAAFDVCTTWPSRF